MCADAAAEFWGIREKIQEQIQFDQEHAEQIENYLKHALEKFSSLQHQVVEMCHHINFS